MTVSKSEMEQILEAALEGLAAQGRADTANEVRLLIYRNYARNRIRYKPGDFSDSVQEYVMRVADNFEMSAPYLRKLQVEKDEIVWAELFEKLHLWAYNYFLRKGFMKDDNTWRLSSARATDAAIEIMTAHFPFDVDFEPWARVILHNVCRKFIRSSVRREKNLPLEPQPIDELEKRLGKFSRIDNLEHQELNSEIIAALTQINSNRREVIILKYFEGKRFTEIARLLERSVGAVYSLHYHALNDLRKILTLKGNRNE